MTSRAWASLALALLLTSVVAQAQVDPGARTTPTQTLAGPITAFTMAGTGAVAAGMNDTGRTLGQPTATPVWTWWDSSGSGLRSDRADENNCGGTSITVTPLEPCIGDVVGMALSSDGNRIAVAAVGNTANEGRLLLLNAQNGPVANFELPTGESPTSVAMSPDGTRIVIGLLRPEGANPDLGRVRLYNWPAGSNTPAATWSADTVFPVRDVAVGADGKVAAVAQDRHYRFTTNGGSATAYVHDTDATLNAVAMASAGPSHWSVAVAQDGGILLYSDAQDNANPVAAYDLQPGSSPQRAAAMSADAKLLAVGDNAGVVRLLRVPDLTPEVDVAFIAQTATLDGPVHSLQISGDGAHLAIAAGKGTYLYRISNSGLSEIWRHLGAATVGHAGVSSDAEFVASASGAAVTVFPARHAVTLAAPASTSVTPGATTRVVLTLSNTGNRDETVPLTVAKPADWVATLDAASVTLRAGQSLTVGLNVTPPAFAAPGVAAVQVTHRVRSIPTTTDVNLAVAQLRSWSLGVDGALNRGIDPGSSVRFPLLIQNQGNGADTTALTAEVAQAGWTASVSPATLTLAKGAFGYANVTVTAPAGAANGAAAQIAVALDADSSATLQLTATIGARFGVTAVATPSASAVQAGHATAFTLRITNTGNTPDTYSVTPGPTPSGWLLDVDDAGLSSLASGAAIDLAVTATPPAGETPGTYQLTLRVESSGDATKSATARHDLTVQASGTSSSTDSSTKAKGSPGPGFVLVLAGLALVAVVARNRRAR